MPTWNSYTKYFPLIVARVMRFLDPHHFIVIDRHSTDKTVEAIKSIVPKNKLKLIKTNVDLQIARKLGANLADTDVICFVDSDILIPISLKKTLQQSLRSFESPSSRIGAVGFSLHSFRAGKPVISYRVIRAVNSVTNKEVLYRGLNWLCRGHLFLCFLKRSLLQDWEPNPLLSAFEDFSLSQHILKKRYYWVELTSSLIHTKEVKYRGLMRFLRQGLWEGANLKIVNINTSKVLLTVFGRLIGGLINRNLGQFITYIGYTIGYLAYPAFRVWKR
ncbi:glycosyltransferase family 2 protein [Thermofilum sp.]|uniref:glycosyltransferase family A protein n=1 Tax=Thermofilum sp. TaxID=1961369 RepID=UPI00319DD801